MNSRSRILLSTALLVAACSEARAGSGSVAPIADRPLAEYRKELLEIAFDTASALPTMPHVKTRSRLQAAVTVASLELDQPRRALGYSQKIESWQRGVGYAEYAFYCARHGDAGQAQQSMDLAREVYEKTEKDRIQEWQRDEIRVTIAKTLAFLGRKEEALRFLTGVEDAVAGQAEAAQEEAGDSENFDVVEKRVDEAVKTGNFDQLRNALEKCARCFDRSYQEPDRRSLAEQKIKASWDKLPAMIRLELMIELTGYALDHGDKAKALDLVEESVAMVEGSTWAPEDRVPKLAQLAGLRHRAGDDAEARREADAALALFDAERDHIVDIRRAGALRPLAETYQSLGDTAAAQFVYAKAIEEGVVNPNSRPRAEDLSATCCSMAVHAFEPEEKLRARILEVRSKLGNPW